MAGAFMGSGVPSNKVPTITLAFWVAKIAATTLGETGGDTLSTSLNLGYGTSTVFFAVLFLAALFWQLSVRGYHPLAYWFVIITTTTIGTTLSDYLDRTLALGYVRTSLLLFILVAMTLLLWQRSTGSISVARISTRKAEFFYWVTILFSNTLGTALGDFLTDIQGIGFLGGAIFFSISIAIVATIYGATTIIPYLYSQVSLPILFWIAFVLTRPLGATLGDLLTKPVTLGGLHIDRGFSSLLLTAFMTSFIIFSTLGKRRSEGILV